MEDKGVLLFILFQCMIFTAVFAAEEHSTSRSAHFTTRENKQLAGYVVERFESRSLLSCGQQCLRNAWCTSTNYKVSSKKNDKGTCELNKHELSLVNDNTKFHDQEGVTFSMRLEVICYHLIFYSACFLFMISLFTILNLFHLFMPCGVLKPHQNL